MKKHSALDKFLIASSKESHDTLSHVETQLARYNRWKNDKLTKIMPTEVFRELQNQHRIIPEMET